MKYSFIFVCQAGELEVKAMLLAASLTKNLKCEHQIIAAIPTPEKRWGKPRQETVNFLEKLGVEIVPIVNEIDDSYPIGNKVSSLKIKTEGDVTVLLDSDIVCLTPFRGSEEFNAPFCAKPADKNTFKRDKNNGLWEKVYSSFGLELPEERMISSVSKEKMLPYFNAGFVAVHNNIEFGETWLMCCRSIDSNQEITNKRPWLDQIALPVSVAYLGINYKCVDNKYNYPCHLMPINRSCLPIFAHYHYPETIITKGILYNCCKQLVAEHPELRQTLKDYSGWKALLYPRLFAVIYAFFRQGGRWSKRSIRRIRALARQCAHLATHH